jgi:hypothetical protein
VGCLNSLERGRSQVFPKWNWKSRRKWDASPSFWSAEDSVTHPTPPACPERSPAPDGAGRSRRAPQPCISLAASSVEANRYTARVDCPLTYSKQTSLVLSNRYKFVPSGGVASWLTHRPHRHFYPVQPANRNRRNPLKTNDGRIFYSIQKATPRGSD